MGAILLLYLLTLINLRPEDLRYYEETGIDRIEFIDRGWKREYILRAAEAYTNES